MVSNVEIQQQQPPVSLPPSPPAPPTPQAPEYVQNYPYPSYPEYGHHGWHRSHRKSYSEKRLFDLIGHQFTNEERVALSAAREEYKRHFIPAVIGGVVGGFLLARRGFFGRLVMFGGSVFGGIWVGRRMGQLAGSNVLLEQLPPDSPVRKAAREVVEFQFTRGALHPRTYIPEYPTMPVMGQFPPPPSQQIQGSPVVPSTAVVAGVAAEEIRDSVAKMLAELSVTVASLGREEVKRG